MFVPPRYFVKYGDPETPWPEAATQNTRNHNPQTTYCQRSTLLLRPTEVVFGDAMCHARAPLPDFIH